MLDWPTDTSTHGPFVEKTYHRSNGPHTIYYKVLEVNGKVVDIAGGYIERTAYCETPGIDAVGFTVRGEVGANGIYILQMDGTTQILERICDFGPPGRWENHIFTGCEFEWDAKQKRKRPFGS